MATAWSAAIGSSSSAPTPKKPLASSRNVFTAKPRQAASWSTKCSRRTRSSSSAAWAAPAPLSDAGFSGPRNGVCCVGEARQGVDAGSLLITRVAALKSPASMQDTTEQPTLAPEAANGLSETAARAQNWAGEPFLRADEDPAVVLAPGTARKLALDDAVAEMDVGQAEPSYDWKRRYALMLGLERVLTDHPPRLASGTELRKHQIDALAGMLTELIAVAQAPPEPTNGNGAYAEAEIDEEEEDEVESLPPANGDTDELPLPLSPEEDPGAVRRFRFRHPTASGKTIAAAGFVEAARTLGVLILTHRRLLVSQFNRDLTTEGYGDRIVDAIERGHEPPRPNPLTIQTYAWFARHWRDLKPEAYHPLIAHEAHTGLREKTRGAVRSFTNPIYIGMTATEQLIAKQVSDVFPASVDDLPLADAARRGLIAPLRSLRVPPAAAIHTVPIVAGASGE